MLRILVVIVVASVAGCGFECAKTNWTGSYLVHLDEASGNCGPFPDQVVRVTNGSTEPSPGCDRDPDIWSDDECKMEESSTCTDQASNSRVVVVAATNQEDADGEKLTGSATFKIYTLDTEVLTCLSTYNTTFTRQ